MSVSLVSIKELYTLIKKMEIEIEMLKSIITLK